MNLNTTSFPVDLILFGMIAAFLILRLRSVLGKRTDADRKPASGLPTPPRGMLQRKPPGPVLEGKAEPAGAPVRPLPVASSPVGGRLAAFREVERGFDPAHFLRGAETAFRRIVEAFAGGDRAVLRSLLTDGVYQSFDQAISAREAAGQTQRAEVRAIQSATIEEAKLVQIGEGSRRGSIEVRFVSDQVSLVLGADGQPVSGADAVTELADRWVFERLYPGEATWRLADARAA